MHWFSLCATLWGMLYHKQVKELSGSHICHVPVEYHFQKQTFLDTLTSGV